VLGRCGKTDRGVRDLVRGVLDRRPRAGVVEHGIDEDRPARDPEPQSRVAHECQLHDRGSTGGASGPPESLGFGGTWLYSAARMANDTAAKPAASEEGVWTTGPDGELVPDYDAAFPEINEGEVVHGTVVRVDKDEVLVDIGYKSEGVIPVAELTIRRAVNPADEVSVGEEIDALVLTKEDAEGRLILSKKRARFEL